MFWGANAIEKSRLMDFYLITYGTVFLSVFSHEVSHMIFAKRKGYDVFYISVCGIKIDFHERKIGFDVNTLFFCGQVSVDYATKIINKNTKDEVLKDIRNNFIVGAVMTGVVFLIGTAMVMFNKKNIVAICISWINCNMLLSSCKKKYSIQDIYGYFNFNKLEEKIVYIIFFQSAVSGKVSEYLFNDIQFNLLTKLDSYASLSKFDLNALILIVSNVFKRSNQKILSKLVKNYKYYKYDNLVLYYLLLCIIVINNWKQCKIKELYSYIMKQEEFISIVKVPIIGYRYVFYKMLFVAEGYKSKGKIWRRWDELRLGINVESEKIYVLNKHIDR